MPRGWAAAKVDELAQLPLRAAKRETSHLAVRDRLYERIGEGLAMLGAVAENASHRLAHPESACAAIPSMSSGATLNSAMRDRFASQARSSPNSCARSASGKPPARSTMRLESGSRMRRLRSRSRSGRKLLDGIRPTSLNGRGLTTTGCARLTPRPVPRAARLGSVVCAQQPRRFATHPCAKLHRARPVGFAIASDALALACQPARRQLRAESLLRCVLL